MCTIGKCQVGIGETLSDIIQSNFFTIYENDRPALLCYVDAALIITVGIMVICRYRGRSASDHRASVFIKLL